jgi:hypothetical protein
MKFCLTCLKKQDTRLYLLYNFSRQRAGVTRFKVQNRLADHSKLYVLMFRNFSSGENFASARQETDRKILSKASESEDMTVTWSACARARLQGPGVDGGKVTGYILMTF